MSPNHTGKASGKRLVQEPMRRYYPKTVSTFGHAELTLRIELMRRISLELTIKRVVRPMSSQQVGHIRLLSFIKSENTAFDYLKIKRLSSPLRPVRSKQKP